MVLSLRHVLSLKRQPLSSLVVKLSKTHFSEAETSLLSKGLSFCPTLFKLDRGRIETDLEKFFRSLRLHVFILNMETESDPILPFRPMSTWMPRKDRDECLESYIITVRTCVSESLAQNPDKKDITIFPGKNPKH